MLYAIEKALNQGVMENIKHHYAFAIS